MSFASFRDKVFNNWQAKLLSFGLAVLLYAAFQIISLDTKAFTVPLEIRAGGNFVLIEGAPEFVRVELRGKAEDIATVQESNIAAYIDIAHIAEAGEALLNVGLDLAENLTLMDEIEVSVSPYSVKLVLEENAFAWVPVEPRFVGSPLDGYEVLSWASSVPDVRIVGAKSIVDSTPAVYADGIVLTDKTQPFRADANIVALSNKLHILGEETTSMYVEIIPQIITIQYENVVPFSLSLASEFAFLEPLPFATFEISGEKNPLSAFVPPENIVEIDFSEISEIGEYTLPVVTNIPVGFTLNSINLTEVTVQIIEAPPEEVLEVIAETPFIAGEINEASQIVEETE